VAGAEGSEMGVEGVVGGNVDIQKKQKD